MAQPDPEVVTQFPGIAEADVCSCEPPDPWIAVSPTHIVQTTNGMVRISNRSGTTLLSEPTWALFDVPADHGDSDPRILWDAVHGRWVGVVVTYNGSATDNTLQLAISETGDPTGAWTVYPIGFANYLPDYPGISTSSSKIVLTSDDFLNGVTYVGPTWLVIDWSNVLAGTTLFVGGASYDTTGFGHFRPAISLSTAVNTPVIYQNGTSPWYFEISGTAHAPLAVNEYDLNATFGALNFSAPPDPVQPGAIGISTAVDERPTDAVFRSGQLWFVSTGDYNDGVDDWAYARYTQVATSANGSAPTSATDLALFASGTHFFMPGVGIDAHGSAIFVATKTDPTSTYPTTVLGGVMAGSGLASFVDVEASTVAYTGTRWGDFVGVAADPLGAGAVWVEHELVAGDGTWRTSVIRVVSDGAAPGLPGAITQTVVVPATLPSVNVSVKTSWGAAADPDSGVAAYLVERSDDGGAYAGVRTPGTSITQPLRIGHAFRYRISAIDAVGNVGAPTNGPTYHPTLYQQTSGTVYTGTWGTGTGSGYSGGSVRYASTAGRYATFTTTTARSIAIVTTKASSRGSFKVYVDNVYKGTISTYSTTTKYRQLVFQYAWTTPGTHKIKIYVVGTSGHPRVDVDAFVVLR